jgi:hypothetical protein
MLSTTLRNLVAVLVSGLAVFTIGAPLANAVPILYNTTFTAALGPSGTGSFVFDSASGDIPSFVWDFGSGIVGGTSYVTDIVFGDTIGRFVFEILSETNAHSGINCINIPCSVTSGFTGLGPNGATVFYIQGTATLGSSLYEFRTGSGTAVAAGSITTQQVPEATTLSLLLSCGVLGIALTRRWKARNSTRPTLRRPRPHPERYSNHSDQSWPTALVPANVSSNSLASMRSVTVPYLPESDRLVACMAWCPQCRREIARRRWWR